MPPPPGYSPQPCLLILSERLDPAPFSSLCLPSTCICWAPRDLTSRSVTFLSSHP